MSKEILEKQWPDSKNIARTKYYPITKVLEIQFKPSGIYLYYDVSPELWRQLSESKSPGIFFAQAIKGKFKYQSVK